MMKAALERVVRDQRARIIAALATRYRDLNLAEDAFAEACLRAATAWLEGVPDRPDAWLYRTADRCVIDALRKRRVRERAVPDLPEPEPTPEEAMMDDTSLIPDERLRLIFICCHPGVAPDARAALTLRLICGLPTAEIARAFLVSEPTLAQRLVRAKRKIAEAGVPFEIPQPKLWGDRIAAVLSTLEIAYSKAHEDAAGTGPNARYAAEMLELTRVLAELLPDEPEALALAATIRFAEARRPARIDPAGAMVPLSEQDPTRWLRPLIDEGQQYLTRALELGPAAARTLHAAIHAVWCARKSLAEEAPWCEVLLLYDALVKGRDDPIVRLNRAVALAEVEGPSAALQEVERVAAARLDSYLPYQALRADLLRRLNRQSEAASAYDAALELEPTPAERLWLEHQRASLAA